MTPTVFISYSHQDETWKNRVEKHLNVLAREGDFELFVDRAAIKTGDPWQTKINNGLKNAEAAILLISSDFLTSDFIQEVEVKTLLERQQKNEVRFFPVIIKPCAWDEVSWLKDFQVFNGEKGKALSALEEHEVDTLLAKLAKEIKTFLQKGLKTEKATAPATGEPVLLTRLPMMSEYFIGRDEVLKELDSLMKEKERVVLINGMGGIGKTEVCRQWFLNHYREFQYAGWIDYIGSIRQSFFTGVDLPGQDAGSDKMDERYRAIMSFLENKPGQVLLVVDNIEDPDDKDLGDLRRLPFPVLASSRQTLHGFASRNLDELSLACCKELFYQYYDIERGEETDDYVEQVIGLCGYHTLTVELLARAAQNAAQPIKWLHDNLKDHGIKLTDEISPKVRTHWHDEREKKELMEHLDVVFDLSGLDEREINILINLSILPAMDLGINDIREWLNLESNEQINSLIEKGWLKRKGAKLFMHQVISDVVLQKHPPDMEICGKLVNTLGWKLFGKPTDNPIDKMEVVVLGESVFTQLEAYLDEELSALANNLSLIYKDLGQLEKALKFHRKATEIFINVPEKNHSFRAASYNNSSLIYHEMGRLKEALYFQKKAIHILEKILEKNHPDLATSYNNLSMIYKDFGQQKKALEFQMKAIDIYEAVLDKNHPSLAVSYDNLSIIYKNLCQLEKALELSKKANKIFETVFDKDHPSLACSYYNSSLIYLDLKKYPEALDYSRRAVAIMETLFPNGHYNLDKARNNLEKIKKAMKYS